MRELFYFGTANRMTNMTRCKRVKRTMNHMTQANSRWNACCSRTDVLN